MTSTTSTVALAHGSLLDHEAVLDGCAHLEAVGATALVGVGLTLDDKSFLVAKVFVGDEGSLEVNTEPEARAGEPLPRQALSMAAKLRDLAPQLVP